MNESNTEGLPQGQPQQQAQPVQQPVPQPAIQPEQAVPQSRVTELVQDAWHRGHEKGKNLAAGSIGGMSPDDYRKIAREEAEAAQRSKEEEMRKAHEQALAKQTLDQVENKLAQAKASNKYPDFDETIKDLGLEHMLPLVWHANTVDNTAALLYDLGKNPLKLAMLNALPPHRIQAELKKLSDSIKANEQAETSTNLPPDPFGKVKPTSNAGVGKRPSDRTAAEWRQYYKGKVRSSR